MNECVRCGSSTTNRRHCKACLRELANDHWRTDGGSERTVEVVCECGYENTWDPETSGADTQHHDELCGGTTRYQAVANDGAREPTRSITQRGGATADA